MTISNNFPIGYFYIVSRLNGLVVDVQDPENAKVGSHIVMATKKPESPERDSQLFIHQNGFLTNKLTGHVLDIDRSGTFMAIFTGEEHLFLDGMKEADDAEDQRFAYDIEHGFIYSLADPKTVFDIKGSKEEESGRVMVYKRKEDLSEATNQLWTLELSDPPRPADEDDSSDEEDSTSARVSAWFGSWSGWKKSRKDEALNERDLERAAEKVEKKKKKKSHMSYNLMAGAAAFAAVKAWENKQEEDGQPMEHAMAKKLIATFAAAEITKLIQERGSDSDDEDEDEEKKEEKQKKKSGLMEKMAKAAAMNYFEKKYMS
ncbi:hypothetical protein BDB00DRAFT_801725 [Zychaea mexicana]|uniref:uncharacterized protein n=1 Tax=Zychaea mexicana TaxID=64656 RepID=UPI0022FF30DE|nr:uncharacterized protein BDB00DRAFT_801725 [Zychaea mexicana]KAI9498238.1 hypothetical protein BDB00DRAFT_801725 [Zychaea mexicana]